MAADRSRKIFVNLSVRDLERSVEFWKRLGFEFNAQFCDESAACMVFSEEAFAMLLAEPRFKDFARKQPCDTRTHTEGLFAFSVASRAEVDAIVKAALEAGGSHAADPIDLGFMYSWSFYDLDGHHWEPLYMDPNAIPA